MEVENGRLREQDPASSMQLDSEMEQVGAMTNIFMMTDSIRLLKQQLADKTEATAEAGHRATEAEMRVAELGKQIEELFTANNVAQLHSCSCAVGEGTSCQ